ncbi:sensor histidine kinase [Phaeodactylibacter xiamenensis]|nr:histidine kinase [Phaeodactylibacter xiamenensis]MCR9054694.1 histidine kinase [bacterium]
MKHQMTVRQAIGIDDRLLMWIGIPLLSFFIPLLLFNGTLESGLLRYLPKWGISFMYTVAYWLVSRQIFIYFRRRYTGANQTTMRLLYTGIALVVGFVLVNILLWKICQPILALVPEQNAEDTSMIAGSLLIVALVGTIYESIYLYQNWKRTLLETEQLRREQVESQLEGLKNQVNPHFLFNSLNTLTYLIPEDQEKAVQFVQKLSRVYRYILEMKDKKLVTLAEELKFLHAYVFLVKERFGDNLQVELDVPEPAKAMQVVPLSLQILFENAIKHNVIAKGKPLTVAVRVEGGNLVVVNKLQPKAQVMPGTGTGLANVRNRYRYFTNDPVSISADDGVFEVRLPMLQV